MSVLLAWLGGSFNIVQLQRSISNGHLQLTILGAPHSCSHQQWDDWEVWELILSNRLLLPVGCRRFVTAYQQSVCGGRVVLDL